MKYLVSTIIWTIAGVSFITLAAVVLPLTLIPNPRRYDRLVKLLCRMFIKTLFIRVQVEGRERVDPSRTYIFISNHVNIFDVFILNGYIPNLARGVELEEHFSWPIWGWMIRRYGNIPISHKSGRSAMRSLEQAELALRNGTSIMILPEGSRTLDGNLRPFKRGAFLLAKRAQVDIVPTALIGAFKVKQKGGFLIRPGKVIFRFGDVMTYDSFRHLEIEELMSLARNRIEHLITQNST